VEEGAIQTTQYVNVVCNSLNIEVSDDYAKATAELIGKFPGTDTISESYANETEFAYHQMTAKFGTSLSNAAGNSATPLKSFALNINNNVLLDEAFLSGSNEITAGGLVMGRLQITGSYSLHFENTTELDKYKANTKNALIVTFTGALIGSSSLETIQFKLGRLVLTSPPVEYNIDGLLVLNQEFEVEYESTDLELTAVVINNMNNASTRVYDKV
jgi:Phage tail tube protein